MKKYPSTVNNNNSKTKLMFNKSGTIEMVKYLFKVNNKDNTTTPRDIVLVYLLLNFEYDLTTVDTNEKSLCEHQWPYLLLNRFMPLVFIISLPLPSLEGSS